MIVGYGKPPSDKLLDVGARCCAVLAITSNRSNRSNRHSDAAVVTGHPGIQRRFFGGSASNDSVTSALDHHGSPKDLYDCQGIQAFVHDHPGSLRLTKSGEGAPCGSLIGLASTIALQLGAEETLLHGNPVLFGGSILLFIDSPGIWHTNGTTKKDHFHPLS